MRVLTTGGLGYIGRVLVDTLLEKGYETTVLDKMLYPNNPNNLEHAKDKLEVVIGDINDEATLSQAVDNADIVMHLAAIVGDQACDLDKERAVHTNYLATRKIAHLCAKRGKHLVFFSTCSVYGAKPGSLISEVDTVLPLSIYSITKLAAEEAVVNSGVDCTILRLGTVYGLSPRMRFDLVINRMIAQATLNRSISVFGGDQYRPFIHVRDVVSNSIRALSSRAKGLYNLGGKNWQILELAERIRHSTGCEMRVFKEIRDPRNYSVDSTNAVKTFGAEFPHDVDSAIKEIQSHLGGRDMANYEDPLYSNADWLRKAKQ